MVEFLNSEIIFDKVHRSIFFVKKVNVNGNLFVDDWRIKFNLIGDGEKF